MFCLLTKLHYRLIRMQIYNPQPKENETVKWSGNCVNGYADGSGKLEWFINMELIEVYEGAYV